VAKAPEIPVDAPPNLDQPADKMAATAVAPPLGKCHPQSD
jgi:hypothetical protein